MPAPMPAGRERRGERAPTPEGGDPTGTTREGDMEEVFGRLRLALCGTLDCSMERAWERAPEPRMVPNEAASATHSYLELSSLNTHTGLCASLRHKLFSYLCNELRRTLWTMVVARLVGKPHTQRRRRRGGPTAALCETSAQRRVVMWRYCNQWSSQAKTSRAGAKNSSLIVCLRHCLPVRGG